MFRDKVERGNNEKYRAVPGFGQMGKEGFREFCRFLYEGGTAFDDHFQSQINSLPLPLSDFDFVGKLENFSEDFLKVLKLANIQPSKQVLELVNNRANTAHVTYSEKYLSQYYDDEIEAMVRCVYRDDFSELSYPDFESE